MGELSEWSNRRAQRRAWSLRSNRSEHGEARAVSERSERTIEGSCPPRRAQWRARSLRSNRSEHGEARA